MSEELNKDPIVDEPTSQPETPQPETPEGSIKQPPPAQPPTAEAALAITEKEIEDGKAFAILSYALSFIGLPFFLLPLIMRDNAFSLYHAKQCLMLWITGMVGGTISSVLVVVFCLGVLTGLVLFVFLLVLQVMGLISASKGEIKPLPLIGPYAEDWFKGIVTVESR